MRKQKDHKHYVAKNKRQARAYDLFNVDKNVLVFIDENGNEVSTAQAKRDQRNK